MLHPNCLQPDTTCLLVIDIQEKFGGAIQGFKTIAANAATLITGFSKLEVPVLATEQYPRGLGATVETVTCCLGDVSPMEKTMFSSTGAQGFWEALEMHKPESVVVCGIETHVCVNQTVHALLHKGYRVHIVVDALGSRKALDHETALRKMEQAGAIVATVEMCLFELLGDANNEHFKEVQKLVK